MSFIKTIALGTGSPIKRAALEAIFKDAKILTFAETSSGVPSQPVGVDQTRQGANNRANASRQLDTKSEADAYVGIENGMWKNSKLVEVDAAVVVMLVRNPVNRQELVNVEALSDELEIPPVEKRIELGVNPGRDGLWSELKDPHSVLTGGKKPRQMFLEEALQRIVDKIKAGVFH